MDATSPISPIQFGQCRIDAPRRTLLRRGQRVEVQAKVFDLLLYLIERRDRVVSAEELLDALWPGATVTPSSLSRAVHKARVAVGDDGEGQRSIATVRGRGFRFVAPLRREGEGPELDGASDFVGRAEELALLHEALAAARGGQGGLIFLTGEPGIGKTRTAHEFATRARASGVQVHASRCPEGRGTPAHWLWRRLGRALAAGRTRSELERLAGGAAGDFARVDPELPRDLAARAPPELPPEELRLRLFEGAVGTLERFARESPLVLLLDDLHLADLPSLQFLRFVSHSLCDLPILLVGTFRDADLSRDEERRPLLADAERSSGGRTCALRPLSTAEVAWLGEKRLGRSLSPQTVAGLRARSGGNPFLLRELLTLVEREGDAALSALQRGALQLPPTVHTAVEANLGWLGEEQRRVLGIAAVFGTEFSLAPLARVAETSPEALLRSLAAAVDAHVLAAPEEGATRYRFTHGLLRDALYQGLETTARARLHLRAAQALEADPQSDPSELAFHWHRAARVGGAEQAVHHCCRAAQHCLSQLAFEQAARHMEQALEALDLLPDESSRRRCELLIETASCVTHFDQPRSGALLLDALQLARTLDPAEFRSLLLPIACAAAELRLAPDELRSAVKEALDAFGPGEAGAHAALLAAAGRGCLRGDPSADALSSRAVELARQSGDPAILGAALCTWHWVHPGPAHRPGRWEAVQEIEGLGPAAGQEALLEGRFLRAIDALEGGKRAELRAALEDLETGARETGHALSRWRALLCRATLAALQGRLGQAERLSDEALALGRRHGIRASDAFVADRIQKSTNAFLCFEVEGLGEGLRAVAASRPGLPLNELALAHWHLRLGDLAEARRCLDRCSREDLLADCADITVAHMLARISSELREPELCEAVYTILLAYRGLVLVTPSPLACFGPAGHYLALLSWALEQWELAEEWFGEAAALCEGLGLTAELLAVRIDHARMLAARGRKRDRRAALEQLTLVHADASRLGLPGVLRRLEAVRADLAA